MRHTAISRVALARHTSRSQTPARPKRAAPSASPSRGTSITRWLAGGRGGYFPVVESGPILDAARALSSRVALLERHQPPRAGCCRWRRGCCRHEGRRTAPTTHTHADGRTGLLLLLLLSPAAHCERGVPSTSSTGQASCQPTARPRRRRPRCRSACRRWR